MSEQIAAPALAVIMEVAGSGKTTVAALVAALDCPFQEGDALHPPANVEKMSHGMPLTDAGRACHRGRYRRPAAGNCLADCSAAGGARQRQSIRSASR
ncbi:MAG: hypothetical protein ABI439_08230 [Rhodospirillales bacterium]